MHFGRWEILCLTLWLQKRSERSHERWRPYSFRTNYSVNSQAFILVATLRISLKKITSEVKFAERKSALLQNNNVWKKNSTFCSVLQGNSAVASPKEQLYEQMTPNPAFTERNIQKANAYLLCSCQEQKSLVTYHALQSLYVCVWFVNTLTSTAPIGSPIICMWSPAEIWEQWERNLSFSSADVRGAGTRDEPLRTSAWELWFKLICTHVVVINIKYLFCQAHGFLKVQALAYTTLFTTG